MNSTKKSSLILILLILIFFAINITLLTTKSLTERTLLKGVDDDSDIGPVTYMLQSYLPKNPELEDRYFEGSIDASVTIAFYATPQSEAANRFLQDLYPELHDEYIKTGKIRFYPKHHLTLQDYSQRTDNYLYAASLSCFLELGGKDYFVFYLESFDTDGASAMPNLAEKLGLDKESFKVCTDAPPHAQTKEDLLETANFGFEAVVPYMVIGIEGRDIAILQGVPSYTKLNRTIRRYLIRLGE